MTEPTYTLEQARQILLQEQCAAQGHVLSRVDSIRVRCSRCTTVFVLTPE